ncbi:MAG: hypothetical protein WAR22_11810 [Desulfomonilia bacterium]|jgi:hypothetical protein
MAPARGNEEQRGAAQRMLTEIRCLTCCGGEFLEAAIRNDSKDGLYLECDREAKPGGKARTHMLEIPAASMDVPVTNESTGTLRWCRIPADCSRRRWGVGIGLSRVPR